MIEVFYLVVIGVVILALGNKLKPTNTKLDIIVQVTSDIACLMVAIVFVARLMMGV